LATVKRIKKRYTFFSIFLILLIVLIFNLTLSSSSKTDIIQHKNLERPQITHKDISDFILKIQASATLRAPGAEPAYVVERGEITNKPFYCELRDHNIPSSEILLLSEDFKKVFNFKRSRKGDKYRLFFSSDNQLQKIEYERDILTQFVARRNNNSRFDVVQRIITLEKKVIVKEFVIEGSLFQAILSGNEGHALAFEFTEIFSWDIDFFLYPRKGDRVQIEYEKLSKDGRFVKYGKILAARYIAKGKTFSAFLFNDGKYDSYYDELGKPMRKMFLRVPIKSGHITSSFSLRRFHPVLKKYRRHTGIDYGSRTGTPIFATANGKVRFSGRMGGYGKLAIVVHPNGYETYYGHCSRLLVKPGQFVNQGEVIARVGSTGHATGPHVHYEVRINRKPVNPNLMKSSPGKPLAKELLPEYKIVVSKRLESLKSAVKIAASHDKAEIKS
jgi:murein DD-endopeptidase MepM/ murein hydrolase activator NlpD